MSSNSELSLTDAFALLKLPSTASAGDIRKSYRTLSLLYHPDKAKDVSAEVASDRFHNLHKAYELLSDPVVREKLARQAAEEDKRKERVGKFEQERKKMSEALEQREREEAQRRRKEHEASRQRELDLERLKEEGRKMREAKSQARTKQQEEEAVKVRLARQQAEDASRARAAERSRDDPSEPSLGPLDTTVRLLYPTSLHQALSTSLGNTLTSRFGGLINLRLTVPQESDDIPASNKRKRLNEVTCLATFEEMSSAIRLVEGGSDFRLAEVVQATGSAAEQLDQVWVEWAAAKDLARKRKEARKRGTASTESTEVKPPAGAKLGEPARVTWWRSYVPEKLADYTTNGVAAYHSGQVYAESPQKRQSSTAGAADFESDVLRRAMEAAVSKKESATDGDGEGDVERTA
ncbi:DnaJ-domain-containing protein [Microstroma glucosiphilum]|uniref:DnaJ-domain-containing protein n=1 Tax=Pseudomicrostroma glucosiphilum TaxID=1684307 RepID=A0A316UD51_9BASI|nr:DnaJ-domain-containing protein [Pseudomicrostroma glucosiphilum]PWN23167.1 DnaJ-domain-containing protein [Pseudomicrostroma glucosiphilum]